MGWPELNPPVGSDPDEAFPTDKRTFGYYPAYAELAQAIGPAGRVLEAGVYHGGSMRMWQELFPDGLVAGADNWDGAIWPDGTVAIRAAQDSPDLAAAAKQASPGGWDLIVDDASHHAALTEATWRLLWPLVKPGGWYVIEDWTLAIVEPWRSNDRYGGQGLLRLIESFIPLLEPRPGAITYTMNPAPSPQSGIGELKYLYGLAMLRKVTG